MFCLSTEQYMHLQPPEPISPYFITIIIMIYGFNENNIPLKFIVDDKGTFHRRSLLLHDQDTFYWRNPLLNDQGTFYSELVKESK